MSSPTVIYDLYRDKWSKTEVIKDVRQHPARYAKNLIYEIIKRGMSKYWVRGSRILDPYAGVGLGGIASASYGLDFTGVELNEKFVNIALSNFKLYDRLWEWDGFIQPKMINWNSLILDQLEYPLGYFDAVITSPPYGNRVDDHGKDKQQFQGTVDKLGKYGNDAWQIGNIRLGEEYWMLTDRVMNQVSRVLKPNGVIVLVLKAHIKNKKIVDLPTLALERYTSQGYELVEEIHAMLVKPSIQSNMFNELMPKFERAYVSYFAWVYWQKYGLLVDKEVVLVLRNKS